MAISDQIRTIIWDWNGTLLNDINLSIDVINALLGARDLPLLTPSRYKEVFSFPVKDYYEEIGFDFRKEPFEIPAHEFIALYNAGVVNCGLHDSAIPVLEQFRSKGLNQLVLSAMEHQTLLSTLGQHRILPYFDEVSGLDNVYAVSKVENGKALIQRQGLSVDEICLVGDTIHDFEVAEALGCSCVLIADGHQSFDRLKTTGCPVLSNLSELIV